jgi:type I restriction enzyme S subunit
MGCVRETLIGPLPDGWDTATLGDLCARGGGDLRTGPFGTQLHARDYVTDGVPIVMPRNIGDNVIRVAGIARVGLADADRLEEHRLRTGDIVYSRRGDVERRALVRAEQHGWLCGTGCLRIRPGRAVSSAYLAHYLGHPAVRRWVVRHAVGVTMPNLNTAILSAVPVVIPPRPTQDAIAEVLDTLELKIAANGRVAASAVDLGTALFARATVTVADGATSTANGDDDGDDGGDDGATVVLGDIVDLVYGKALKEADRRRGPVPVYGSRGRIDHHDTALTTGPAVIVGRKGNAGAVSWAPVACWPIDTAFAVQPRRAAPLFHETSSRETLPQEGSSQDISFQGNHSAGPRDLESHPAVKLRKLRELPGAPRDDRTYTTQETLSQEFLFFLLRSLGLRRLSADSAVPGLGRSAALSLPVRLPPTAAITPLTAAATSLLRLVDQMERENHALTALRDTLLPKLISGQLRIADAEKADAGAA